MTMRRTVSKGYSVLMLTFAVLSVGVSAQKPATSAATADAAGLPVRIWKDPGDMASLNLNDGAGGKGHAPDLASVFTFVSDDAAATSPKFDVIDQQGVGWKVKLGPESQSETAATRFLWAAGYFTDEDYYLADLKVAGLPIPLKRGQEFLSPGGVVHGARMERKRAADTKLGDWDWFENPFVGTRDLNGLRVMMSLLNSWDLKQVNNAIYVVSGERQYVVSDVGATFGKTGSAMTRTRGVPRDFEDSKFIDKVTPGFIDFVLHSRPLFLGAIAVPNYRERTKMEEITKHIPRGDVRWLAQRLSRLTAAQVRDGFRAGGFEADDVETLAGALERRIAALGAL